VAETPRIERYTDAMSYVDLPGFTARRPTVVQEVTFVQYEGDTRPRAYTGQHTDVTWEVSGVFGRGDAAARNALVALLNAAHASADRRLRLTVGGSMEAMYPVPLVVALDGQYTVDQVPKGSGIFEVSMTFREVM
jgi:hypothetical protein